MQQKRSPAEQKLPEYAWKILDAARSGFDLYTGKRLTEEEVDGKLESWGLPAIYKR